MKDQTFQEQLISLSDTIYPMVYRLLNDESLACDAVQDVIIKLWDRRKQLSNHPNIVGYALLTARNHCLDKLKEKHPDQISIESTMMVKSNHSGHEGLELSELVQIIQVILEKVPENQREVMVMRDLDGYEFEEISAALDLPITHLRVLLSRARKTVRIELQKIYSYEQAKK